MPSYTNFGPGQDGTTDTYTNAAVNLRANAGYQCFLWCPTARSLEAGSRDSASRTSTTCFIRGIKHTDYFVTNNGDNWLHRRIIFRLKGDFLLNSSEATPSFRLWLENSNGYTRTQSLARGPGLATADNLVFEGTANVDWNDRFVAKVDTQRVTVMSDKTSIMSPKNTVNEIKRTSRWYPINKNLVYDDEENGKQINTNALSVDSLAGCGDVYIFDMFGAADGTRSSTMSWRAEATLYWHER